MVDVSIPFSYFIVGSIYFYFYFLLINCTLENFKKYFSSQKKGSLDAEEQVGKAHARAVELQKQVTYKSASICVLYDHYSIVQTQKFFMQVDQLKGELETQNREKGNWETRVLGLEKKVNDLNSKLEDVSFMFTNNSVLTNVHLIIVLSLKLILNHYLQLIFV